MPLMQGLGIWKDTKCLLKLSDMEFVYKHAFKGHLSSISMCDYVMHIVVVASIKRLIR